MMFFTRPERLEERARATATQLGHNCWLALFLHLKLFWAERPGERLKVVFCEATGSFVGRASENKAVSLELAAGLPEHVRRRSPKSLAANHALPHKRPLPAGFHSWCCGFGLNRWLHCLGLNEPTGSGTPTSPCGLKPWHEWRFCDRGASAQVTNISCCSQSAWRLLSYALCEPRFRPHPHPRDAVEALPGRLGMAGNTLSKWANFWPKLASTSHSLCLSTTCAGWRCVQLGMPTETLQGYPASVGIARFTVRLLCWPTSRPLNLRCTSRFEKIKFLALTALKSCLRTTRAWHI